MLPKSLQISDLFYLNYINFLISLIPISFIAGNLIINLNIFLIIVSSILIFKNKVFLIKYNIVDKYIFFAFGLVIFSGTINTLQIYLDDQNSNQDFNVLIKSFYI